MGVAPHRRVEPGDHVCFVFSRPEQRSEQLVAWVAEGLRRGERMLYIGDTAARRRLVDDLDRDPATAGAVGSDDLMLLEPVDVYRCADGTFDPSRRMLEHADMIEQSLAAGWSAVRMTAEATHARAVMPDHRGLATYEALLDTLCATKPVSGMCLYEPDDGLLAHAHGTHRRLIHATAAADVSRERVELVGEFDTDSLDVLTEALAHLDHPTPVVDCSGVAFIDTAATAALVEAAQRGGRRLSVDHPPAVLLRILDALGWTDRLAIRS